MVLTFKNAKVSDIGYGLEVNDKNLQEIISTALGTRVGNNYGLHSGLPDFKHRCCNVTVIIDPQPITEQIDTMTGTFNSVQAMEEAMKERYEQFTAENQQAETKE